MKSIAKQMYVIATKTKNGEEYLREEHGDDCFSDDLSHAYLYEFMGDIPPLHDDSEYITKVYCDEEGGLSRVNDQTK